MIIVIRSKKIFWNSVGFVIVILMLLIAATSAFAQEEQFSTAVLQQPISIEEIKAIVDEKYNPNIAKVPGWIRSVFGNERMNWYINKEDESTLIVGVVSKDGKFIEIKEGEVSDPTSSINVDEKTLWSLIHSDDPVSAFQVAFKNGEIKLEGVGVVNQVKYFCLDLLGKIAAAFTTSSYEVKQGEVKEILYKGEKATLKLNPNDVRIVEFQGKEEVSIINKYGVEVGSYNKTTANRTSCVEKPNIKYGAKVEVAANPEGPGGKSTAKGKARVGEKSDSFTAKIAWWDIFGVGWGRQKCRTVDAEGKNAFGELGLKVPKSSKLERPCSACAGGTDGVNYSGLKP